MRWRGWMIPPLVVLLALAPAATAQRSEDDFSTVMRQPGVPARLMAFIGDWEAYQARLRAVLAQLSERAGAQASVPEYVQALTVHYQAFQDIHDRLLAARSAQAGPDPGDRLAALPVGSRGVVLGYLRHGPSIFLAPAIAELHRLPPAMQPIVTAALGIGPNEGGPPDSPRPAPRTVPATSPPLRSPAPVPSRSQASAVPPSSSPATARLASPAPAAISSPSAPTVTSTLSVPTAPAPREPGTSRAIWPSLAVLLGASAVIWMRRSRAAAVKPLAAADPAEPALRMLRRGKVDDAVRLLQDQLPREGGQSPPRVRWALALAFLAKKQVELTLELTVALELDALSLQDLERLARELARAGADEEAVRVLRRILARDVAHAGAARQLTELETRNVSIPTRTKKALELRFTDIRPVGAGGMGCVYRGTDRKLRRAVAIKVPDEALLARSDSRARFLREARLLASFSHPGIVQIYDIVDGEAPYFTMELVEGRSLRAVLDEEGRLSETEGLALMGQVAEALAECHTRGIIHRDIKPENILIDQQHRARVADFGLAFPEDVTRLTLHSAAMGTLAYMAPEQFAGAPPAPTMDVYAFGLVLIEVLTGQHPFTGEMPVGRGGLAEPKSGSSSVDALVRDCLRAAPSNRPADARAVAVRMRELTDPLRLRREQHARFVAELEALLTEELHTLKNRALLLGRADDALSAALQRLDAIGTPAGLTPDPQCELAAVRRELEAGTEGVARAYTTASKLLRRFELPLRPVVEAVAARYQGRGQLSVHVDFPPPPCRPFDADAARADLDLILDNLVQNALQAGAGRVELRLGSAEPAVVAALIRVIDDGPGFPETPAGQGTGLATISRVCQRRAWRCERLGGTPTAFALTLAADRQP